MESQAEFPSFCKFVHFGEEVRGEKYKRQTPWNAKCARQRITAKDNGSSLEDVEGVGQVAVQQYNKKGCIDRRPASKFEGMRKTFDTRKKIGLRRDDQGRLSSVVWRGERMLGRREYIFRK